MQGAATKRSSSQSRAGAFTIAGVSLAVAAIGLITLLSPASPVVLISTVAAVTFVIVILGSRSRMAPLTLSPLAIVAGGILAVAVLGALSFESFQSARFGSSARIDLDVPQTVATLQLMVTASASILLGGLLVLWLLPAPARVEASSSRVLIAPALYPWLLVASVVPIAAIVATTGSDLLQRDLYLDSVVSNSPIISLMNQLAVAAVIILGFLIGSRRGIFRVASVGILLAYVAVFAAGGSRTMAMAVPLAALGAFAARRSRGALIALLLSLVAAFYLVQLSLYFRTLPAHGLIPYLSSLGDFSASGIGLDDVSLNLLFSFGIIGATAFQSGQLQSSSFWVSVNPMPGDSAGWYDIASTLRLNINTPFAGLGELANYGMSYLIGYCLLVGVIIACFERQSLGFLARGTGSLALVPLGLSGLFLLYVMQYNLRSSTRLIVYGLVIAIVLQVVVSLGSQRRSERVASPA